MELPFPEECEFVFADGTRDESLCSDRHKWDTEYAGTDLIHICEKCGFKFVLKMDKPAMVTTDVTDQVEELQEEAADGLPGYDVINAHFIADPDTEEIEFADWRNKLEEDVPEYYDRPGVRNDSD